MSLFPEIRGWEMEVERFEGEVLQYFARAFSNFTAAVGVLKYRHLLCYPSDPGNPGPRNRNREWTKRLRVAAILVVYH
ncbi:hypothetical protein NDU88_005850 [Pleurodeles waltl]|uniref:Uncharacterized protein n=1 Tax=Pleurodeles waltl TaxID=8319 RepID=A0AAV7WBV0_PLEWA|nr:hypothetical protein NDU88_005850 [Pleurodeles waltl]